MKQVASIFLAMSICFSGVAQELKFKKRVLNNLSEVDLQASLKEKNNFIRGTTSNSRASRTVQLWGHNTISLARNEAFVHKSGNTIYKTKSREGTDGFTFSKVNNGVLQASMEFEAGGSIEPLSEDGNFIYCDFSHGEASGYFFYTNNLERIRIFAPYPNGFAATDYDFDESTVCIYAQEQSSSKVFRMTLLTHAGEVIANAEFDRGNYLASDVRIKGDRYYLLMNSTTDASSKIIAMDNNLQVLWSKSTDTRVAGYKLDVSPDKNIVVVTQNYISSVSHENGKEQWKISMKDLALPNGPKTIQREFVMSGAYMALVATSDAGTSPDNQNTLTLLDTVHGRKVYSEKLKDNVADFQIVPGKSNFYLTSKSGIYEYTR